MAEILKIKIKVGGVEVEITPEEAKELSAKLDELLGKPSQILTSPYVPYTWPTVICESNGTTVGGNVN